ncbi:MAG TPA: response regulator transcription factor [Arthrobacter sp.]|nr:response regulator transcription factor [Arthrobacter sp.]
MNGRDDAETSGADPSIPGAEPGPITVVLADDEFLVRAGVRAILGADPAIDVVAEAADGHAAVAAVARFRPSVVLLDIRMPRFDGLAAAREMAARTPGTRIIMLTTFGEDDYIDEAMDLGASGFLLKTGDPRELLAGIRAVAAGAAFLSPAVARRVVDRLRGTRHEVARGAAEALTRLTARERDVLALLGAGLSNTEIGRRLFLTEGTVKGHVSSVLVKLGARNRVQAALTAFRAGLIPPGA